MSNVIDPTAFRTGDIVHVRGKVAQPPGPRQSAGNFSTLYIDDCETDISNSEIVAHFPAIRSWSEIEGRLTALTVTFDENIGEIEMARAIIALLNEIDPKGDA